MDATSPDKFLARARAPLLSMKQIVRFSLGGSLENDIASLKGLGYMLTEKCSPIISVTPNPCEVSNDFLRGLFSSTVRILAI